MMKEDIEILAVDMPESPNIIKVRLYETNPSNNIPENAIDEITKGEVISE